MCDIDSGAAGRRDARACGGWWRRGRQPVQPDKRAGNSASSREIGAGLRGTWGRILSSRQREPVRSPPLKKNLSKIVCSRLPRVSRPKWRLHQRVQRAKTLVCVFSASAMWCVRWRRGRPLRRPCTSAVVTLTIRAAPWPSMTCSRHGHQLFGLFCGLPGGGTQSSKTNYVLHFSR